MWNRKRLIILVALLSTTATAGSMGPARQGYWDFTGAALYLQPSFGGNGLGYTAYNNYSGRDINGVPVTVNAAPDYISNIVPRWNWGFQLGAAYHPEARNDYGIEWYHYRDRTGDRFPVGSLFSGSVDGFYAGYFSVAPQWDAVNLEIGHLIDFEAGGTLRLHGGVDYSRIKTNWMNYPRVLPMADPVFITSDTVSYSGFGPHGGADFGYGLWHNLDLYAKAAASVLVGTAKQSISGYQNYSNSVYGLMLYGTPNYVQSRKGVIVTQLEAKLGFQYRYDLSLGSLTCDVGYLWVDYLQSILSFTGIGIVGSSVGNQSTANFNLNGAYFGLKWTS